MRRMQTSFEYLHRPNENIGGLFLHMPSAAAASKTFITAAVQQQTNRKIDTSVTLKTKNVKLLTA